MVSPSAPPALQADYFDGRSARAQPVHLRVEGHGLRIEGDGVQREVPLRDVVWPERTRHGQRTAHFADGGSVQAHDAAAWDTWYRASALREPMVVRLQQSWRGVFASVVLMVAVLWAGQQWGLPIAAKGVTHVLPPSVDTALGEAALEAVDEQLMHPSKLPASEQARIRAAFTQAVGSLPAGAVPPWQLVFRASRIGPNALALPGGTIIMTDDMVDLVEGNTDVLTAVLAHELGHLQHRHSVRMLVQVTLLGTVTSVLLGDFSTVLAGGAALVGQAHYSRTAEREADAAAVRVLRAAHISPAAMVTLFDKMAERRAALKTKEMAKEKTKEQAKADAAAQPDGAESPSAQKPASPQPEEANWLGIAFASHPPDEERVRFFKNAAAGQQ